MWESWLIVMLQVMLCYEKSTRDVFAMKVMKKAHILQQPDVSQQQADAC